MSENDPNGRPPPAAGSATGPSAEPTAAELFDPAAFARRIAEARERRREVLARQSAPPGADLPPKPARIPTSAASPDAPTAATVRIEAPGTGAAPSILARLLDRLGWRPFAVFSFAIGTGFGAAALLAAQFLLPAPAPAPSGLTTIALLPGAEAAPRPDLPAVPTRIARGPVPDAVADPRRVAAVLPGGGAAPPPQARPADLVLMAALPANATASRQARRAGPAPGLPGLLDRMVADTARAAATLARDLRRLPRELSRPDDRRRAVRSTRGPRRN